MSAFVTTTDIVEVIPELKFKMSVGVNTAVIVRVATVLGTQRQVATKAVVAFDPQPEISVPLSLNWTLPAVLACAES